MKTNKTTDRFERAVTKLYNAFHAGKLDAFDCKACAVGNICDNDSKWISYFRHSCYYQGSGSKNQLTRLESFFGQKLFYGANVLESGYDSNELYMVEEVFLSRFLGGFAKDKDLQFQGLCAVVEYLAELDGIPNPMDYTALFETTEQGEAKLQLSEVIPSKISKEYIQELERLEMYCLMFDGFQAAIAKMNEPKNDQ